MYVSFEGTVFFVRVAHVVRRYEVKDPWVCRAEKHEAGEKVSIHVKKKPNAKRQPPPKKPGRRI